MSIILYASPEILEKRLKKRKHFSRFELLKSRKKELKYYKNARNFIKNKGFNVIYLENGSTSVSKNVKLIMKKINYLLINRGKLNGE